MLREKAYTMIKEKLLNGTIKPGARIREDLIAEEISMSRTPVREAINNLSAEGFVSNIPRKGIFATKFNKEELVDIIEVRAILESYAARRCCKQIKDSEIIELETIFDNFKQSLNNNDQVEAGIYDGMFHKKIAEFSRNKKAKIYINDIEDLAMFIRRMDSYNIRYQYSEEKSIQQHERILTAIKNRDEETAAKEMEINTKELLNRIEF